MFSEFVTTHLVEHFNSGDEEVCNTRRLSPIFECQGAQLPIKYMTGLIPADSVQTACRPKNGSGNYIAARSVDAFDRTLWTAIAYQVVLSEP